MKDLRKFSGTNKSPARLMAGSKVSGKKEKLGPSFSQIWYAHMYIHTVCTVDVHMYVLV